MGVCVHTIQPFFSHAFILMRAHTTQYVLTEFTTLMNVNAVSFDCWVDKMKKIILVVYHAKLKKGSNCVT